MTGYSARQLIRYHAYAIANPGLVSDMRYSRNAGIARKALNILSWNRC